jgi:nucleoid-associated protein YgaU
MGSTKLWVLSLAAAMLLAGTAYGAEEAPAGDAAPQADEIGAQRVPASDEVAQPASAPVADEAANASPAGEAPPTDAMAPADLAPAIAVTDMPVEGAAPEAPAAPAADAAAQTELGAPPSDAVSAVETEPAQPAAAAPDAPTAVKPHIALGEIGYDDQGRRGRIHIVKPADTLWDISEAYLGTPWVWPSIWDDNRNIENPHLIEPGDRIWITPTEMRRVTREEAATLLGNKPPEPAAAPEAAEVAPTVEPEPEEVAPAPVEVAEESRSFVVSDRESAGLITPEQLKASASIVGSKNERVMLGQEDEVYIGLGESHTHVGDEFTIFRTQEQVFDPDTGALLGYHVEVLGWLQVLATHAEASDAKIAMSTDDIEVGDRVMPREILPPRIEIGTSPDGIEGKISYFAKNRVLVGSYDYVYLNRGTDDGVGVGCPLEVYRAGYEARDEARRRLVEVPDRVVADLLVVRAAADASVALVTHADTELSLGDRFRGATH